MSTPEQLLEAIGNSEALENLALHWTTSMEQFPGGDALPFLQPQEIRDNAQTAGFPEDEIKTLLAVAQTLRQDDLLTRLVWHAYWRVFLAPEPCGIVQWPEPPQLGDQRGVPYLLVALGFVPLMRKHHAALGISEEVIRATARQAWHYCQDNYKRGNGGRLGTYQGQLNWLRHYTREPYVRLGRMEFWYQPNDKEYVVFQNRKTGSIQAFLPPGETLLNTGYYPPPTTTEISGIGNGTFHTTFRLDGNTILGTPCSPDGNVLPKEIALARDEWEPVLQKGDPILAMHIPSGGGMTQEACLDAFQQAKELFSRLFPERPPKAITCTSWIFNTQLQEILPEDANLCRLQKTMHLLPAPGAYGLWFIFLQEWPLDFETAPRDTSLQRSILEYLQKGHPWRVGQSFLLMNEIHPLSH